ncbi:MAG: hypothetical protein IT442_10430 [Phycisphaeraceae bacterium]|nr:hypothetical protein [Phycisphaeraceae bacterium]
MPQLTARLNTLERRMGGKVCPCCGRRLNDPGPVDMVMHYLDPKLQHLNNPSKLEAPLCPACGQPDRMLIIMEVLPESKLISPEP